MKMDKTQYRFQFITLCPAFYFAYMSQNWSSKEKIRVELFSKNMERERVGLNLQTN